MYHSVTNQASRLVACKAQPLQKKVDINMPSSLASAIGLLMCLAPAVVHAAELVRPLWARWVVNWVLPFFGPGLPSARLALGPDDQMAMLDAAQAATPSGKERAGADYIFLLLFEQRQGALAFLALAVGILYALSLPLADRHALHLVFAIMAALFTLANANHAGIAFLGHHPRVSRNGRHVGVVFSLYWVVATILNFVGFAAVTSTI